MMNRVKYVRRLIAVGFITVVLIKSISLILRSNYKYDIPDLNANYNIEYKIRPTLIDNIIDLDELEEKINI